MATVAGTREAADTSAGTLRGIGLSAIGYALFAIQDATVKWLVATVSVPEILLVRSLVITAVALLIGRQTALRSMTAGRQRPALLGRAVLILAAWLSYYNAAAHLGLAEITTLYFAAPIVAVLLAAAILKERIVASRWLAVGGGFCGVVLAAQPREVGATGPVAMALFAACCWGMSVVLARLISRSETTAGQMLVSNLLWVLACLPIVLLTGHWPPPATLALMLSLGVVGRLGQWFLYEGFRTAPASAVAPVEYTGLVWAFLYGYAIWGEVPGPRVFAGAALIVAASLLLVGFERRRGSGSRESREDFAVADQADRGPLPVGDEKRT